MPRRFLFPSPPHLISLSCTWCKQMRHRTQQNNCVKEQLFYFALWKLKGSGGGLEADSKMGKLREFGPSKPSWIAFLLQCKPAPYSFRAEIPRLDLLPHCTWDGNRNIPIYTQLEKALETSRAVIHHRCGTHSSTHKPAKPPQDKWSQQQLTQNPRHKACALSSEMWIYNSADRR